MIPLSFGIIRDEFPRAKVAGAVGVIAPRFLPSGPVLALVLAGPIVEAPRRPLVVLDSADGGRRRDGDGRSLRAGVAGPHARWRLSWLAALLLSGWLVAPLVGVSEAPVWGWGSGRVLGLLALWPSRHRGAVGCGRAPGPCVPVDRHADDAGAGSMDEQPGGTSCSGWACTRCHDLPARVLQTPTSSGYGFGASVTRSGLYLLPLTVTMFVGGLFTPGRSLSGSGREAAVVFGSFACMACYSLPHPGVRP